MFPECFAGASTRVTERIVDRATGVMLCVVSPAPCRSKAHRDDSPADVARPEMDRREGRVPRCDMSSAFIEALMSLQCRRARPVGVESARDLPPPTNRAPTIAGGESTPGVVGALQAAPQLAYFLECSVREGRGIRRTPRPPCSRCTKRTRGAQVGQTARSFETFRL